MPKSDCEDGIKENRKHEGGEGKDMTSEFRIGRIRGRFLCRT